MKESLKKGDKVAVYIARGCAPHFRPERLTGEVRMPRTKGLLTVYVDDAGDGKYWDVHPKQCRRLVKRERRRVWLHSRVDGRYEMSAEIHPGVAPQACMQCSEFIEVSRKGKR